MMNYEFSNKGKAFLISLEGICLNPYLDSVGVKTIGIGSTISDVPNINDLPWDYTLTIEQALDQMNTGLKKYIDAVNEVLEVPVTQFEFDALVSITYNIGTGKVKARSGGMAGSSFMKRLNVREIQQNIAQAILMWNKPPEIIGRRKKEVKLFVNGYYGDGRAQLFPTNPNTHKPMYSKSKIINIMDYI